MGNFLKSQYDYNVQTGSKPPSFLGFVQKPSYFRRKLLNIKSKCILIVKAELLNLFVNYLDRTFFDKCKKVCS